MTVESLKQYLGRYIHGSLFRKLKKTWVQLGLSKNEEDIVVIDGLDFVELKKTWDQLGVSDEEQNKVLIQIEKGCLYMCLAFLNKKNKDILSMKEIETSPRLGCSRTSMSVNDAHYNLRVEYNPGSLLRKLKIKWLQLKHVDKWVEVKDGLDYVELEKTWVQLGQTDGAACCSGPSVAVNEARNNLYGEYSSGSLLRKLKKTRFQIVSGRYEEGLDFMGLTELWGRCGLSVEEQNTRLLKKEREFLLMYKKFFKNKYIIGMKNIQTKTRVAFSVTSMPHEPLFGEYSCGSLLRKLKKTSLQLGLDDNEEACLDFMELKKKWVKYGRSDEEQTVLLLKIERKCVRKCSKFFKQELVTYLRMESQLEEDLRRAQREISSLSSVLGVKSSAEISDSDSDTLGTIEDLVRAKRSTLIDLKKQKQARTKEFLDVLSQIHYISGDIAGFLNLIDDVPTVDEYDLSQEKLKGYKSWLQKLQNEKKERLQKVSEFVNIVHDLCAVLGMDSSSTLAEVHPSLNDSADAQCISISNNTLARLADTVLTLTENKKQAEVEVEELEDAARDNQSIPKFFGCLEQTELRVDMDNQSVKEALSRENMLDEVKELMSALKPDYSLETIKDKNHEDIMLVLEELRKLKDERRNNIQDLLSQICNIPGEFDDYFDNDVPEVDESDLSQELLEEYQFRFERLAKEKKERLQEVSEYVNAVHHLCAVLGMDSSSILAEIHPSLNDSTDGQSKSISGSTISRLDVKVSRLTKAKKQRLRKLKELASQLYHLWNRTDTPLEERTLFDNFPCKQAEVEVVRLESRVKEIAFKKHAELKEAARGPKAARDKTMALINSGCIEQTELHVDMDNQTTKEALSREDMLDEDKKLMPTCDESVAGISDSTSGPIMKKFNAAFEQLLEELRQPKEVRIEDFSDLLSQMHNISGLSQTKLEGYQSWFQKLQTDKKERLQKVSEFVNTVQDLCAVLGMDSSNTLAEVHPSLNDSTDKSISNSTVARLADTVLMLKENKKQRLHKLKELASKLIDLWNLMDTPPEERNLFDNVTCNISASIVEVTTPGALALDLIKQAEVEVERLDLVSRVKEIAFKKQAELGEIFAHAHIKIDMDAAREKITSSLVSGDIEPIELLVDMDNEIEKAKKEALSRKDILDLVRSWLSACEEERWLEDYNRDENRYNTSRDANLNIDEEERAKEARILVNKIPDMVDTLVGKTRAWEETHGIPFTYDGDHLLEKLYNYAMQMLRNERKKSEKQQSTGDRKRDKIRCWAPFFCGVKSMPASP